MPDFSFKLLPDFLDKYKEVEPPFGFRDVAGTQARLTRYMNSTGSNQVICEGAGQDSSTATVRSAYFVGAVYAGSSVTTGKVNVALAESSGTGNGVKIITGSWLKLTPLA